MFAGAGDPEGRDTVLGTSTAEIRKQTCRDRIEIQIPPDTAHLPAVRGFLRSLLSCHGWTTPTDRVMSELQLALQEACVNAIRHSTGSEECESITVTFVLLPDGITIEVSDRGRGFDPTEVPEPDATRLQEGGYGVFIIREFMEVRHAPVLLCRLTDLWVVLTGVSLLGSYFVGMALSAG